MVETNVRTSPGRAILAGLVSPSLSSLAGAVVVAAGLFLFAMTLVTPERVGIFGARFGWDRDVKPRLASTIRTLALRHEPPSPGSVVLLGASDLRSLVLSDELLATEVERRTGRRPEIRNLALPGASVWITLATLEHVPDGFSGVVVFTTSPERLAARVEQLREDYAEPALGLKSYRLDAEADRAGVDVPERHGVWFLDHLRFYGKYGLTLLEFTLEAGRPRDPGPRHKPGPWPDERRRRTEKGVRRRLLDYDEAAPATLARIARAFTEVRSRTDAQILLLEAPRRPDWAPDFYGEELLARHNELLRAFAAEQDVERLDMTGLDLAPEDFADHCHLRSEAGRRMATTLLAARIAEMLEEER